MKRQQKVPYAVDRDQNGYPDAYEEQESALLRQMAARRKSYLRRFGSSETKFINADNTPMVRDTVFTWDVRMPDNGAGRDEIGIAQRLFGSHEAPDEMDNATTLFGEDKSDEPNIKRKLFR